MLLQILLISEKKTLVHQLIASADSVKIKVILQFLISLPSLLEHDLFLHLFCSLVIGKTAVIFSCGIFKDTLLDIFRKDSSAAAPSEHYSRLHKGLLIIILDLIPVK